MSYILGVSQTGKTQHLLNQSLTHIHNGEGVFFIGDDAIDKHLQYIPSHRQKDVIIFDPSLKNPATINLLDIDSPEQRPFLVRSVLNLFRDLARYDGSTGLFDSLIRNLTDTALNVRNATLLDIYYLLTGENHRYVATALITDPFLRAFWEFRYKAWAPRDRVMYTSSTFNQLDLIVNDPFVRRSLCYHKPTIHLPKALAQNKIILCRLPRHKLGESTRIIGVALLAALQVHVQRYKTNIFVDDIMPFAGATLASVLEYNPTISNHSHAQLPLDVAKAILNNSEEKVLLRLGGEDAELFDRILKIHGTVSTTKDTGDYYAYMGSRKPEKLPKWGHKYYRLAPKVIDQHNTETYRRSGEKIEREINQRANEVFGWSD